MGCDGFQAHSHYLAAMLKWASPSTAGTHQHLSLQCALYGRVPGDLTAPKADTEAMGETSLRLELHLSAPLRFTLLTIAPISRDPSGVANLFRRC